MGSNRQELGAARRGVAVLALLSNGMNLLNITPFVQTAIKGILLMAVVALQSRKKIGL